MTLLRLDEPVPAESLRGSIGVVREIVGAHRQARRAALPIYVDVLWPRMDEYGYLKSGRRIRGWLAPGGRVVHRRRRGALREMRRARR